MVDVAPTESEKLIIAELAKEASVVLPGTKVRFVRRLQVPGEQGLLFGVLLPSGIDLHTTKVFVLQDICEAQSQKCKITIGLSINRASGNDGFLDLSFLPAEMVATASPPESIMSQLPARKLAASAAVLILILAAAFIMDKQKKDIKVVRISRQRTVTTPLPKDALVPWQPATNKLPATNQFAPTNKLAIPLIPKSMQSSADDKFMTPEELAARKRASEELANYSMLLRSKGHWLDADKVLQMQQRLP